MSFAPITESLVQGRRVVLRVDVNVPVTKGVVDVNARRIQETVATIRQLQTWGARVVVLAHRGRPEGRPDPAYTLEPIAQVLCAQLAPGTARFLGQQSYDTVLAEARALARGDVLFLENVRFHPGEEQNDSVFSAQLADLGEIYVDDAFANAHRAHASMVGIASYLPAYAGPGLLRELRCLEPVRHPTQRPFVAIVGGAKIASKLHALSSLLKKADQVFVGGGVATAFFVAQGKVVGTSRYAEEDVAIARKLSKLRALRLPEEVVVRSPRGVYSVSCDQIQSDEAIEDIGPRAVEAIRRACQEAQTLLWNGPLGIVEQPETRVASDAVAHIVAAVARGSAYGVVGGGDTVEIPLALGLADLIDHVSTGGSAMLEYVGEQVLPGLAVLTSL